MFKIFSYNNNVLSGRRCMEFKYFKANYYVGVQDQTLPEGNMETSPTVYSMRCQLQNLLSACKVICKNHLDVFYFLMQCNFILSRFFPCANHTPYICVSNNVTYNMRSLLSYLNYKLLGMFWCIGELEPPMIPKVLCLSWKYLSLLISHLPPPTPCCFLMFHFSRNLPDFEGLRAASEAENQPIISNTT